MTPFYHELRLSLLHHAAWNVGAAILNPEMDLGMRDVYERAGVPRVVVPTPLLLDLILSFQSLRQPGLSFTNSRSPILGLRRG